MTFKNILVHVDSTAHSDARVALAADLARGFDAHLTGLYVIEPEPNTPPFPTDIAYGSAANVTLAARLRSTEAHAEQHFREQVKAASLKGDWRPVTGLTEEIVPLRAGHMDLTVVGQSDPDDAIDIATRVATRTLVASGRPILVVPYAGRFPSVGTNIIVAWTPAREATRAVNDALPLLKKAKKVTILTANPDWNGSGEQDFDSAAAIVAHLARHGVTAETERVDGREVSVGDMLLNRASDLGADLLVAGGYGHSRMQELMLGGVTRTLFEEMTLPVLMSH